MRSSPTCRRLWEHFETCVLAAYPDPKTGGAPWTIGWGATGPGIGPGVVWTQLQADNRLLWDIAEREEDATAAIHVPMKQGQFDAFVLILGNIGHGSPMRDGIVRLASSYPSSLLRLLNAGDYAGARAQFIRWVSPGSTVANGLKRRRATEQAVWDGLDADAAIAAGYDYMRTIDNDNAARPLGPAQRPETAPAPPQALVPVGTIPGVFQAPDGKWQTNIPTEAP